MVWFSTKKLRFKMKESTIVVADRGRKHFIVPVSLHHTLQFSNHVFLHILFNGYFTSSFQKFNLHPSYQPPVFLENQTWPMFEILKHWEILIRSVMKDFNSRLLCPPPALIGKVLKMSQHKPNHICNAICSNCDFLYYSLLKIYVKW